MMGGLSTAIRTLTILPAPGEPGGKMASSLPWFPLVGGAIGSILLGLMILLEDLASGHWPGGAAAVVVVAGIILPGALHLDGLADWADGFGGGRDREKTLAIMKDSSTGAFGAVALISVLLLKWVALSHLAAGSRKPLNGIQGAALEMQMLRAQKKQEAHVPRISSSTWEARLLRCSFPTTIQISP